MITLEQRMMSVERTIQRRARSTRGFEGSSGTTTHPDASNEASTVSSSKSSVADDMMSEPSVPKVRVSTRNECSSPLISISIASLSIGGH